MNQVESTLSAQLIELTQLASLEAAQKEQEDGLQKERDTQQKLDSIKQQGIDRRCSCNSNSPDAFGFISLDELSQQLTHLSTEQIKPAFTELGHTESPRIEIHFNAPVTINISNG